MTKRKMAIQNVCELSNEQLFARIRKHGVEIPDATGRYDLIRIAYDNGLWRYDGDVVNSKYKQEYGAKQRCGDDMSETLNAATRSADDTLDMELLLAIQMANGLDPKRWEHLNPGQRVMNTSNVLRNRVKKGEYVIVGSVEFNANAKMKASA